MNRYRKCLIRHCEVFDATAAMAVAIQGRWRWLGRTSLAMTSLVGSSACIFGLKKDALHEPISQVIDSMQSGKTCFLTQKLVALVGAWFLVGAHWELLG